MERIGPAPAPRTTPRQWVYPCLPTASRFRQRQGRTSRSSHGMSNSLAPRFLRQLCAMLWRRPPGQLRRRRQLGQRVSDSCDTPLKINPQPGTPSSRRGRAGNTAQGGASTSAPVLGRRCVVLPVPGVVGAVRSRFRGPALAPNVVLHPPPWQARGMTGDQHKAHGGACERAHRPLAFRAESAYLQPMTNSLRPTRVSRLNKPSSI